MKIHVDAWDTSYGSSVETAEADAITATSARINHDIEFPQTRWKPIAANR